MNSFLENATGSLLEKGFGARIKEQETGKAVKYLMVVMLILGSIIMIKGDIKFNDIIKNSLEAITNKCPDFELKDGKFVCRGEMPFVSVGKSNIAFIIDTSGKTRIDTLNNFKSGIFITENNLVYKKSSYETTSYKFSDFKTLNITKSWLINVIRNYTIPVLVFVFIIGFVFIIIGKMIGVLFLTLIALILARILKTEINYENIFKISIYAIIVPTILNNVLDWTTLKIPYFWVIYYAIAIFFLVRYIKGYNVIPDEVTETNE